jgi:hypothetical protein
MTSRMAKGNKKYYSAIIIYYAKFIHIPNKNQHYGMIFFWIIQPDRTMQFMCKQLYS